MQKARHPKTQGERKLLVDLEKIIQKRGAKNVLLYFPLSSEVDISALLWKLKKKLKVFIPYIQGDEFCATPLRLPLQRGKFGIFQPLRANLRTQKIDLMVVPSLACDRVLGRVGFGRGYYDRFYAKLRLKPYIIFVSYLSFFVKEKITQDFDICGDIALSPKCRARRKKSGIYMDRPYNRYSFDT